MYFVLKFTNVADTEWLHLSVLMDSNWWRWWRWWRCCIGYLMWSCHSVSQPCEGRSQIITTVTLGTLSWGHHSLYTLLQPPYLRYVRTPWEQVECDWYYCGVTKDKLHSNYQQSFISIIYNGSFDSTIMTEMWFPHIWCPLRCPLNSPEFWLGSDVCWSCCGKCAFINTGSVTADIWLTSNLPLIICSETITLSQPLSSVYICISWILQNILYSVGLSNPDKWHRKYLK